MFFAKKKTTVSKTVKTRSKLAFEHFSIVLNFKNLKSALKKKKVQKALLLKKYLLKRITFTFKQNNVFCTFTNVSSTKTLHLGSAGIYKIKISKNNLKRVYSEILNRFFKKLKRITKNFNNAIFNLFLPKKFRKYVLKIIFSYLPKRKDIKINKTLKKKKMLIRIIPKTCYNGCQGKKLLRKKRRRFTVLK